MGVGGTVVYSFYTYGIQQTRHRHDTATTSILSPALPQMLGSGDNAPQGSVQTISPDSKAAEPSDAEAQFKLGKTFQDSRDFVQAVAWYRKATVQGFAKAQNNLGGMYFYGHGVAKDDAEVVRWYRKAADQELGDAQYNLSVAYIEGQGVAQNDTIACMWVILALSKIDLTSSFYSIAISLREELASRLTKQQFAEAQRLAQEWEKSYAR
ncbi:hypothetical protein AGMMS50256_00840 [Betaproteobacteria bacterium]|nr:hypothetical protein AGMMS50256_00840 [Betaproteobacteria bacterium]